MARAGLVVSCRNRPKLPVCRKETSNLMTPFAHLPVAVPRHRAVPLRWYHRHGTSRLSTSPAGQSASSAPSPIRAPNSRPPSRSGNAGEIAGPSRKRSKAHEMARRVRDRHCLARQTPPERPVPCFDVPLAPDAFRCAWTTVPSATAHSKSGSSDNAPENALDKKTVVSRGDPVVALPSADGGPCAPAPHPLKPSCRHSW